MAPTYPSADDVQSWLDTLTQQTRSHEEAAQKLSAAYGHTSVDNLQALDDNDRLTTQLNNESQASRQQLIAQLQAYEDRARGVWAGPGVLAGYLELGIPPDLSTPPSGEQVRCACACV